MITIYCLDITKINFEIYQKFYSIVSKERKLKADNYHFLEDSKRCVFGEILLRYSLYQFLGSKQNIQIDYNQYGKAFTKDLKGFFFNLSHSGKWVVFAYCSNEIGVDIEKIIYNYEDVVNNFFSDEEKQFIYSNTDKNTRAKRFTQIWTLKESYIKYLGTGLYTSLNTFSVNVIEGVVKNSTNKIDTCANLKNYLLDDNYYLSVYSQEANASIKTLTVSQLLDNFESLACTEVVIDKTIKHN